jgi:hypothetical protein
VRFRFDAPNRSGGLRLIEDIPDYGICHLEGRNGVGKSLALRLLELVTGQQPYGEMPGAWMTLKENLGATTVSVEGLDGEDLVVELRPTEWPAKPDPVGEWLGGARIGATELPITEIRRRLVVVRIAGDETFEGTIRRRLASESAAISRAHDRFEAQRSRLDELLAHLSETLAAADPERAADEERQLEAISEEIVRTEGDLRRRQEELSLIEQALLARRRHAAHESALPDVETQLAAVETRMGELEDQLRQSEARQAQLLGELSRGSELETQIAETRARRDKRLQRFQRLERETAAQAAQLGVTPDVDSINAARLQAEDERKAVASGLESAGHNASVRTFTAHIARELDGRGELRGEVVAVLEGEQPGRVTGAELRAGVQRRQVELAEVEDDPLLTELREDDRRLVRRISDLRNLRSNVEALDRARDRLRSDEADLTALVDRSEAAGERRTEYETLAKSLESMQDELRQLLAQQAQLRVRAHELTAGKSAAEVAEDLALGHAKLGLQDATELDLRHRETTSAAEESRVRLRQLRAEQLDLQRSVALRAAELDEVRKKAAALTWLPTAVRRVLASGGETGIEAVGALRVAASSVHDSLYLVRDYFDQLVAAAERLAVDVGHRDHSRAPDDALLDPLAQEIGRRLRDEFDQDEIRQALFDGGKLIEIDLNTLEAKWQAGSDEVSRPFEAFSSGEQVFAYTRARIKRVEELDAPHKVIALDEFGAFLARDRLERLARYLRDEVVGQIADQVVIVVPLAARYERQAAETTGELQERFTERARQITQRHYFAEDATKRELV